MASIGIDAVVKKFPGVVALDTVSVEIASGEFFTLLGPSGCGKTTLLRTVAGFYRQDSGHISVDGELLDDVPAYQRETGMVFQNYAVFPHMTVFENVAFGLKNRKVPGDQIRERVARALKTSRLSGYESRTPDKLSGGQQQRVGLARAMVIEPRVLLLDEPLSNLDAKLRVDMRQEIRDIQQQLGTTAIYVTHDQEEALAISDRIAVMRDGRIQQIGTPWEVYKEPVNRFVASFVGQMNFIRRSALGPDADLTRAAQGMGWDGADVELAVRPEEIEVELAAGGSAGGGGPVAKAHFLSLPATVRKSIFIGSTLYHVVVPADGVEWLVERHRPGREDILSEGTPVSLAFRKKALFGFDGSGECLR
jgi:iron(III) transport system ATP-binding protein